MHIYIKMNVGVESTSAQSAQCWNIYIYMDYFKHDATSTPKQNKHVSADRLQAPVSHNVMWL